MKRVESLRKLLQEQRLDSFLIMQADNRRYISGFTGTSGYALVTQNEAYFFTDSRYVEQATAECIGWTVVLLTDSSVEALPRTLADVLSNKNITRLGYEKNFVSVYEAEQLEPLTELCTGFQLVPSNDLVSSLRTVKDDEEISRIIHAASIADDTFAHVLNFLRPGLSELDVSLEIEFQMRKLGASGVSFTTIVASGWRSALPHGVASKKVLESGDFVTMDFGAVYEGYVSDLTRTVCLGKPSDTQREIYEIVLEAQIQSIEAARAGQTGRTLDAVARDFIQSKGYGDAFGHSLGHGIGLNIHEQPRISRRSEDLLQAGMVITIEPGIYLPKIGGVRIEDDVVLSDDGCRVLTKSPKELICI